MAFRLGRRDEPALEVCVNFGVFAGRHVTPAEIDDLARALHAEADAFTIVAQDRHEFGGNVEAALHQVSIEIAPECVRGDADALSQRVVALADEWVEACIASRHSDLV